MKETKETKKVEKVGKKLFTKKGENDTIRKEYSPLKVNYRLIYKRRDGLYMDKEILKEIKRGLNFKDRIIVHINKKTFIKVFNKTRIDTINKLIK
ncbi:MAG: hypothetical protein HFJ40_00245 [Clostridia bacterium]|nr:hypothetical protein [Clostridia bacterium]